MRREKKWAGKERKSCTDDEKEGREEKKTERDFSFLDFGDNRIIAFDPCLMNTIIDISPACF